MSKLQASSVRTSVKTVLAQSGEETFKEAGGKKRNFVETIELQVGLKNYDPQRDKRFVSRSRRCLNDQPALLCYGAKDANRVLCSIVRHGQAASYPSAEDVALHSCRRHGR